MTPGPLPGDLIKSHSERIAEEEREREEKRSLALAEQRSDLNSPELRICAWERMHGLRMPSDPEHPVLYVIAVGTRLTIAEVQHEQRMRASRSTPKGQE